MMELNLSGFKSVITDYYAFWINIDFMRIVFSYVILCNIKLLTKNLVSIIAQKSYFKRRRPIIERLRNLILLPDAVARRCVFENALIPHFLTWGQVVYMSWWPSLTK